MKFTIIRRLTALVCSVSLLGLLCACAGANDSASRNGAGKGGFADRTLSVFMGRGPAADVIKASLPEFESETGLRVDLQIFSNEQLSTKLTVQLDADSSSPDVFMLRPLEELKLFHKNGWLLPLDDYVRRDADYEFGDFSPSAIDSTTDNGQLLSIPLSTEQQILYYRKDLLQKAGIPVPRTLDELEEAAAKLHDPQNGVYGFVARGQKNALVTQLSSFIFSEGGDFQTGGRASLNSPDTVKGMTRYVNLLKRYGPPGVMNMGWPQAMGIFAQGKAAFYTDASAIYSSAADPDKSAVADKVGYALFPAGQAGAKPFNITAWGMAINAASAKKEAAWTFLRWATSKDLVMRSQQKGNPGARSSVWNDPQGVSGFPKEYIAVVNESIRSGVGHDRPQVISVGDARDVVGDIVIKGLLGEDVQESADKANIEFQLIMDRDNQK
ncbi:putative ABC transporter-binding protein precursor [Paenibacillus konkukensis]|uniref:ABC transporter-binding protein n=1 Tax=Paenibacillus konkukensis TaxID=2020716 RepID=A0ABY4RWB0_9BACL|nr:sugar ABC transporter substrate-binding protein [Paenibacillus konkukensis]UQZ86288.1 putative ABC transporter-binding protein precursor [Paenibacillus konkukensis]